MLRKFPLAIRQPEQPVLVAREGRKYWWESLGVFNPGVTEYNGQVVLLYRAYDNFRISRLGLAHSFDGIQFTQYDHPAIDTNPDDVYERIGLEDPRITKIDDTYYIIHTSASYNRIGTTEMVGEDMPWRVRVGMHTTQDFRSYKHW